MIRTSVYVIRSFSCFVLSQLLIPLFLCSQLQFEEEQRKGRPKYYESSSEPESQNVTTEKSDSEVVDEESDRVPKRVTRSQPPQKTRKRGRPALKDSSNREVRKIARFDVP